MRRVAIILLMTISCMAAHAISLNGVSYTIDTLALFPAGPGAEYYQLRMLRSDGKAGRLDCYLMRVDTRNEYVSIESVMAKDALIATERPSAMATRKTSDTKIFYAGTNGDFYITTGDVGLPVGFSIINNEFARIPSNQDDRRLGAVSEEMQGLIGSVGSFSGKVFFKGDTMKIHHINYTRSENQLVLYNRHNAASTLTNEYGTELRMRLIDGDSWHTNCRVQAVVLEKQENVGNMSLSDDEFVLSAHGTMVEHLTAANVGDTLTIKLSFKIDGVKQNVSQCVAGDNYALIVNDGVVEQSNFWNENHPRTAFGQTITGDTLLFLVVDGRGKSNGCTTKILGEIINYYGAYKALNWDGGGSSCMYIRPFGQMNVGSDGNERAVANGMFAVANIPAADNTIAAIAPYIPNYSLPRYGVAKPQFLGYNKYGVLIDTDVQDVVLSCDPSVGEITADGMFLASGPNGGILHAALGNISTDLNIRLVYSAPVGFRLDSVLLDNNRSYIVEVQSTIGNNTISVLASSLSWISTNTAVALVDAEGAITGVSNGYAQVIGQLGEFADTLLVHVEIPESEILVWDNFRDTTSWKVETPSYNPLWVVPQETTSPMGLQFTFKKGRGGGYLRLNKDSVLYSLPDTIRLTYTTDITVAGLYMSIRANNDTHAKNLTYTPTNEVNTEFVCNIPVAETFGTDIAIYPLHFEGINYTMATSNTNGNYHLYLNGISLIYGDVNASGVQSPTSAAQTSVCKVLENGQLLIIRNGIRYTIHGAVVNTNKQ